MKLEKFFDRIGWLEDIVLRIEHFKNFEQGWNNGRGKPLSHENHKTALKILKKLLKMYKSDTYPQWPRRPIVKLQVYGFTMEWDGATGHMQVMITNDKGLKIRFLSYTSCKVDTYHVKNIEDVANTLRRYFKENLE